MIHFHKLAIKYLRITRSAWGSQILKGVFNRGITISDGSSLDLAALFETMAALKFKKVHIIHCVSMNLFHHITLGSMNLLESVLSIIKKIQERNWIKIFFAQHCWGSYGKGASKYGRHSILGKRWVAWDRRVHGRCCEAEFWAGLRLSKLQACDLNCKVKVNKVIKWLGVYNLQLHN